MQIRMMAQGCETSPEVRQRAESLARRWPRFDPAVMDARFVFRVENHTFTAEAIVNRSRRKVVVATGTGTDFRAALDDLDKHVTRMLKRDRKRRKDHYRAPLAGSG